jgi:DNA-binding transcriptional LysR family regulator
MISPTEPFRVGIVPGVTVTKWISAWKDRRPKTPITVVPLAEEEQRSALIDGLVDVCFVRLPLDRDGLEAIRLYAEVPVVVVSKEHPIALFEAVTLADLEGETLRTEAPADAIEIVATGAGAARMPHSIARLHARKDVIAVPVSDAAETEISITWPSESTTEQVEFFVGIVRGRTASSSRGAPQAGSQGPERGRRGAPTGGRGGGHGASTGSRSAGRRGRR